MKTREITIHPDVTLPAISTDYPERRYSFLAFLKEWLLLSEGMRKDENLKHLFEWEEARDKFCAEMDKVVTTKPPTPPRVPKATGNEAADSAAVQAYLDSPEMAAFREAEKVFANAVSAACEGKSFTVSEDAFVAGRDACREAINAACKNNTLHADYRSKVLRHFHALNQSKLSTG